MKIIQRFRSINFKNPAFLMIILNILILFFGFDYLLEFIYSIIWDIFGVILIATYIGNSFFIFITSKRVNKNDDLGRKINRIAYGYLILSIIALIFGMFVGNFLLSNSYSNTLGGNWIYYILIFGGFFSIPAYGIFYSALIFYSSSNSELWNSENIKKQEEKKTSNLHKSRSSKKKLRLQKRLRISFKILCYFTIFTGIFFSYVIFDGGSNYITGFVGILVAQTGLFFAFVFLSATLILLKLKIKSQNKIGYYAVAIIGLIAFGINTVPYLATPYTINNAENNFTSAFGSDWNQLLSNNNLNSDIDKYLMRIPFSTPEYFLGIRPEPCIVERNILFYNGSESNITTDKNISLYFDAYMPLNHGSSLPGANSTLIRIHGGGWVLGDKGRGNMLQVNKFFAAQGYIVFDIQYGLAGKSTYGDPITPSHVWGNFTINDMVRHIGIFTKYLFSHDSEFGANLSSIFISGGSAGGQLACATSLAIASGNFTSIFGNNITVKGFIPFYPANGESLSVEITGNQTLVDPRSLVTNDSPPCLIFQGTEDGLVPPSISVAFQEAYFNNENTHCAILWMPFAGHANDLYFSGYYNQIFLYYMERFMFLYR